MNVAARLLPQEHETRWREFWSAMSARLAPHNLVVELMPNRARVMRSVGNDLLVLLDSFSIDDIPEAIESRLSELVGGAA